MRIQTRLTLWYGGVLLFSVLLIAGGTYYELVIERRAAKLAHLKKEPLEQSVIEIVMVYCVPSLFVAAIGGWWIARRALAPLEALTRAAERISVHNMSGIIASKEDADEISQLSSVLHSMTQRLDQSFGQMRAFTFHASHEMKTPLAVMHAEIELCLQNRDTTPDQRQAFESLLDEIQRLMKIVSGLAFLAQADAGQMVVTKEATPFHELVADVVADAKILAESRQIRVEAQIDGAVEIAGDRHRLRQVLLNLTENAIKYNVDGGVIRFELTQSADSVLLRIANTGAGIPPDQLPLVFDRFFRGDASHSKRVDGSGLGLTITRSIVLAHSGSIQIDSEVAGWTTVTLQLPRAVSSARGMRG